MIKSRKKKPMPRSRLFLISCFLVVAVIITSTYLYQSTGNKSEQFQPAIDQSSTSTVEPTPQVDHPANPFPTEQPVESTARSQQGQPVVASEGSSEEDPDDQPQQSSEPSKTIVEQIDEHTEEEIALSEEQIAAKTSIDNRIEIKISSLRSECKAKSSHLLQSMINEVKSNEEATIVSLQTKFIGQLSKAEASCDSGFQDLLGQASSDYQEAGIPESAMPSWNSQYNKEKAAVRISAISKLVAAFKK
ncbi:hypothetical protein [Cohnella sp.]|uniref:hypothetical protein n=1 Tax=Cohnella sp. TaxID=1883426 RepID=UPI0035672F88